MRENLTVITKKDGKTEKPVNIPMLSDKVKIGKSIYVIERHFSGERDIREAVYAAVKNEAFRAAINQ